MIVVYMCVFFYSFFKTFHPKETRTQKAVRSRFGSVRSAAHKKEDFLHHFASLLSTKIIPSDIISKNVFHLCHYCRRLCFQREQGIRFCFCRSLSVFLFFPFFAFERFAREGLWLRCSLSRGSISLSENSGRSQGGKSMDRHRAIFHTPPLPLFFRARLFAMETAEDFFS